MEYHSVDVAVRGYFVSCTFNQHQMELEAEVPSSPKRRASYALPPSQELRHLQLYVDRMSMVVPVLLIINSSADGTTLFTSSVSPSYAGAASAIVLPPDLLDAESVTSLSPYSSVTLPDPVRAVCGYPYFELSDVNTTLVLLSIPELPIRLCNALALDSPQFHSYSYIHPPTEAFVSPHSLSFDNDGTHFLAGSDSEVAVFDISRPGNPPMERFKLRKDYPTSMTWSLSRGIVSALDTSVDQVMAVGTFGREIGLFSSGGKAITTFSLGKDISGAGVTHLQWTSCGRYLVVGERKSDCILVFDIRQTQSLLQTFRGRRADTMMRMGWSLTENGEVWAGGTDGIARVWRHVGSERSSVEPVESWSAHYGRSFRFTSEVADVET
jgi:WD40 repeat protein